VPDEPVPRVWIVKFFPDLRSQTPTRIAYISRASEAEVPSASLSALPMRGLHGSKSALSSSIPRS